MSTHDELDIAAGREIRSGAAFSALAADLEDVLLRWHGHTDDAETIRRAADDLYALARLDADIQAGEEEGEYVGEHTDPTYAAKVAKQDADDARRQYEIWGGSIVRRWVAGEITADEGMRDLRKLLAEELEIREREERERGQ